MKQVTPGQLVKYLGPLFRVCTKPLKLLCHEKVKYINNNQYIEIKHNFSRTSYVSVGTRWGQLKVNQKNHKENNKDNLIVLYKTNNHST